MQTDATDGADRNIRRDLNFAISRDLDLKNREISFIVTNGDVSVIGTVRTEDERTRINDLAMNIGGVKSVANALRIAEQGGTVYPESRADQNSGSGETKTLREANENIRKAQDEEDTATTSIDPKKTGNKPRFDRDR